MLRWALIVALLLCGCTHYPNGVKEYSDYVEIYPGLGIMPSYPDVQEKPRLVLGEYIGINLLVDERVYGTWTSNDITIILSKDGTAQISLDYHASWKNGTISMVLHDTIIVYLENNRFLVIRIIMLENNLALVEILPSDSDIIITYLMFKKEQSFDEIWY